MLLKNLCLVALSITLTACNISGSAQKGPYKSGSSVTASKLNAQGEPIASDTINTQVKNSHGRFSVDRIQWSGWTGLVVSGQYFDEFLNNNSNESITLNAITRKDRKFDTANVNLYTHLAAARIQQRIADGQNRNNAWRDTQTEMKQLFDLKQVSRDFHRGIEQLDLLRGTGLYRKDNANLLLFTGAFLSLGDSQNSLSLLSQDFADDGEFNGAGLAAFSAIAAQANTNGFLENLSQNLKSFGVNNPPNQKDLPQLPGWVDTDVGTQDSIPPVITIIGDNPVQLFIGDEYEDSGATASDNIDGEVAVETTGNNVDTSSVGEYQVTYSASDIAGNISTEVRNVIVAELPDTENPVVTLIGENPLQLFIGDDYVELGASATDNVDENIEVVITGDVNTAVAGTYQITYTATDSAGNKDQKIRDVVISVLPDTEAPTITIEGDNPVEVFIDNEYVDAGASATDNVDETVTVNASINVDTSEPGSYEVVYTAIDAAENSSEETRVVIVVDNIAPVMSINGDNPLNLFVDDVYEELGAAAIDNVDGEIEIVILRSNVDTSSAGTYEVVYSATDDAGNSTELTRTVIVSEAPIQFSTINARITSPEGEILNGVVVVATADDGTQSSFVTSQEGVAEIRLEADQDFVLKFDGQGLATQVLPAKAPLANSQVILEVSMISRDGAQSFNGADGATVSANNGASVIVSPNSFVNGAGELVSGNIEVTITPVDVSNPSTLAAFPGDFTGILENTGEQTSIISLGTVEYKFTQNGEELQLAEGATADILIPIYIPTYQDGSDIEAGDLIPLWSLNERTGIWEQEGLGTVVVSQASPTGLAMQATVSHFTWWNCDVTMNAGEANVSVSSGNGLYSGSAILTATVDQSCNIGWRPNTVTRLVTVGGSVTGLDIPSSCEVCWSAELQLTEGQIISSNYQCGVVSPNETVNIDLNLGEIGPLGILADEEEVANKTAVIGFAADRVQLRSTTVEDSVTYSIISGSLPEGIDATNTESDTVSINYTVIDPTNSSVPLFVNDQINLSFASSFNPLDCNRYEPGDPRRPFECDFGVIDIEGPLNPRGNETIYNLNDYNVGGDATSWTLEQDSGLDFGGGPVPNWFELGADGILSLTQDAPFGGQWRGILRASNSTGTAITNITLCLGSDCPRNTPIPGSEPELEIRFRENPTSVRQGIDPGTFFFEILPIGIIDGVYLDGQFVETANIDCNESDVDLNSIGTYQMQCNSSVGFDSVSAVLTVNVVPRQVE